MGSIVCHPVLGDHGILYFAYQFNLERDVFRKSPRGRPLLGGVRPPETYVVPCAG